MEVWGRFESLCSAGALEILTTSTDSASVMTKQLLLFPLDAGLRIFGDELGKKCQTKGVICSQGTVYNFWFLRNSTQG